MSGCIYCIDNDILKKLTTFQLFNSTLDIFELPFKDIRILDTAQYKFQQDWQKLQTGKNRNPSDQYVNWHYLLELARSLPNFSETDINVSLYNQLLSYTNIDRGEALLMSLAIAIIQNDQAAILFTGDKRFIHALDDANLSVINQTLKRRIWCLEQLVLRNIEYLGFELVRDRIVPVRDCDQAMKVVFGSGHQSTQANSILALKNYILQVKTHLLVTYPD